MGLDQQYLCVVKIPNDIFKQIEKYMPFSSVDIVIFKDYEIILTKRTIPPYCGYWNLPGSIILKNEKMVAAVKRSSKEELGIEVVNPTFIGNYETFTKFCHYITHLFATKHKSGKIKLDFQSSRVILVDPNQIPIHTVPIQKLMIKDVMKKNLNERLGEVIKFDVIVAVSCGRDYNNNNNNKQTRLGFSRIVQAMAQTVRLH